MQSSNSVLSFYFDMLFVNSIQSVKDSFIGNSTLQENGYSYLQDHNYYLKDEMVEDNGSMPVFVTDIISKKDFLVRLLNFESISIYRTIETEVSSLSNIVDKKEYLNNIFNDLKILFRRVVNTVSDSIELVDDSLTELLRNLKDKYADIISSHSVFGNLHKDLGASYFKSLEYLMPSFFSKLYEVTCFLRLIDDIDIYVEDFVEAFTSSKPQELSTKIKFIETGGIVAYYFMSIKPFFKNFTSIAIQNSEAFLNKDNKFFTASGIDKARSTSKEKHLEIKASIDLQINKLKKQYIK
tara:strand:+ start:114 stop:1001 length:888 start_codon:yes stop_codon:yes gene_type:complete